MNPLQAIPASVRRWLYVAYALLVVAQGATVAGFTSVGDDLPGWLIAAGAVLLYIGAPLGLTAASNTNDSRTVAVTAPEDAPTTVRADVQFRGQSGERGGQRFSSPQFSYEETTKHYENAPREERD